MVLGEYHVLEYQIDHVTSVDLNWTWRVLPSGDKNPCTLEDRANITNKNFIFYYIFTLTVSRLDQLAFKEKSGMTDAIPRAWWIP